MSSYDLSWAPPGYAGRQGENPAGEAQQAADSAPVVAELVGPTASPIEDSSLSERDARLVGLIELILKDRRRLHRLLAEPSFRAILAPRLLAISLAGFALFGVAMSLVLSVSGRWPAITSIATWLEHPQAPLVELNTTRGAGGLFAHWTNGDALSLTAAYAIGLVAADGVCLPSLYFYCLLAGARMTMVEVVLHAVKSKAVASVALVGVLPIYVALAMGAIIFGGPTERVLHATLFLGLLLPAVAGLWGTTSLYRGFLQLCSAAPGGPSQKRLCFLRRLVLAWSACYTAVAPVMIYSIWEAL